MAQEHQFVVHFFEAAGEALKKLASAQHKTPQTVIEELVLAALAAQPRLLPDAERERLRAELKLLELVQTIVQRRREEGTWAEHVTLEVFQEIGARALPLYERAIAGNPYRGNNAIKNRINKQIGARIRAGLDAHVAKGSPEKVSVTGELIQTYTKLFHPAEASPAHAE